MIQHLFNEQDMCWWIKDERYELKEWTELRSNTFDTVRDLVAYCRTTIELLRVVMRCFFVLTVDGTFLVCNLDITFAMFLTKDANGMTIPVMASLMRSENNPATSFCTTRAIPFFIGRLAEELRLALSDAGDAWVNALKMAIECVAFGTVAHPTIRLLCFWHGQWKRMLEATQNWRGDMASSVGVAVVSLFKYARQFARNITDVQSALRAGRQMVRDAVGKGLSQSEADHFSRHVIDYAEGNIAQFFPGTCFHCNIVVNMFPPY